MYRSCWKIFSFLTRSFATRLDVRVVPNQWVCPWFLALAKWPDQAGMGSADVVVDVHPIRNHCV